MSNGFAGLGCVDATELPINNGRDVEVAGEIHVRRCWSSSDGWTEIVLGFGEERRFVALTDEQATDLATLLCESARNTCTECAYGSIGAVVAIPRHIHPTVRHSTVRP